MPIHRQRTGITAVRLGDQGTFPRVRSDYDVAPPAEYKLVCGHSVSLRRPPIQPHLYCYRCDSWNEMTPESMSTAKHRVRSIKWGQTTGRGKIAKKEKEAESDWSPYQRKLTYEDVKVIRSEYRRGTTKTNPGNGRVLCERYGIHIKTLYDIIKFRRWKPEDYEENLDD